MVSLNEKGKWIITLGYAEIDSATSFRSAFIKLHNRLEEEGGFAKMPIIAKLGIWIATPQGNVILGEEAYKAANSIGLLTDDNNLTAAESLLVD